MVFKEWLWERLRDRGWGVTEAADALGLSKSIVSRYLNAQMSPSRRTLRRLADTFDVPFGELAEMVEAQDVATANARGIPADALAAGAPRGFEDIVWAELDAAERDQVLEFVRISLERHAQRQRGEP